MPRRLSFLQFLGPAVLFPVFRASGQSVGQRTKLERGRLTRIAAWFSVQRATSAAEPRPGFPKALPTQVGFRRVTKSQRSWQRGFSPIDITPLWTYYLRQWVRVPHPPLGGFALDRKSPQPLARQGVFLLPALPVFSVFLPVSAVYCAAFCAAPCAAFSKSSSRT